MKKDPAVYLKDMSNAIDHIFEFTKDNQWDKKTVHAVERALSIIGEAANRVPENIKSASADIAWNEIKGLRNLLVHEYEHINVSILKDIIANHLGPLKIAIENLLKKLKG